MSDRRYGARATLFGDGAKGYKLQVYEIVEVLAAGAPRKTGIVETAIKENYNAAWSSTFARGDKTFATRAEAIADYEAAPTT